MRAVDVGVGRPTADIRFEPALAAERFDEIVDVACAAVDELDGDLLVLGEMGIGNTTAAAAVAAALLGGEADGWVGRGTGVDDAGLAAQAGGRAAGGAPHRGRDRPASRCSARSGAPSSRPSPPPPSPPAVVACR